MVSEVATNDVIPVACAFALFDTITISPVARSVIVSVPPSTLNVSSFALPVRESSPAPPAIISLPPPPVIISFAFPPVIVSPAEPPSTFKISSCPVKSTVVAELACPLIVSILASLLLSVKECEPAES